MIRFQPSWILESLPSDAVKSIFLPISPRPHSLLWFKRLGIRMYVNDPVESRAVILRALLANGFEKLSEPNRRKFIRALDKPFRKETNPFLPWEHRLFDAQQLDYLHYWREASFEISKASQSELFQAGVYNVIAAWITMAASGIAPSVPPDELLEMMIRRCENLLVSAAEKIFCLNMPIDELGDEVEADLYVIPLSFHGRKRLESDHDVMFHAWCRGNADLQTAKDEIDKARKGWIFDWKTGCDVATMLSKAGKAGYVAVTWSGDDLPPLWHEEHVAGRLREIFATRFPRSVLRIKAADTARNDYDFLLLLARPGFELPQPNSSDGKQLHGAF